MSEASPVAARAPKKIQKSFLVKDARNLLEILRNFPDAEVKELITDRGEDIWRVTFNLLEPV
jgi:hypothetical protein